MSYKLQLLMFLGIHVLFLFLKIQMYVCVWVSTYLGACVEVREHFAVIIPLYSEDWGHSHMARLHPQSHLRPGPFSSFVFPVTYRMLLSQPVMFSTCLHLLPNLLSPV